MQSSAYLHKTKKRKLLEMHVIEFVSDSSNGTSYPISQWQTQLELFMHVRVRPSWHL